MRVHISKSGDMSKIIDYFNCACILHNWLIDDPIPPQWIEPLLDEDDEWNDRVVPNEHDNLLTKNVSTWIYFTKI